MNRAVMCAMVALAPAQAQADGIAIVGGSPRAIGRAGAATVGDDGGGALLINPAAMARRDTPRGQLGVAVIDDSVQWRSASEGAPLSSSQAGSRLAPLGAAIGALDHWVLGAGVMTAAISERTLAAPGTGDLDKAFDYRYAGIAGAYRRDTLTVGVARRLGDSLALGLALGVSQVRIAERRRIWAGFAGRARPGMVVIGDPASDVDVVLLGTDRFVPSVVAGALYAPQAVPLELAASVAWSDLAALDAAVTAVGTPDGPSISASTPHASLAVRQPLAVRAGGRYVGDRVVVELDGDLWIAPSGADVATWWVRGIRVVDPSGFDADLPRVPSRISQRTHLAARGCVDVELIPGFMWAIGGYAFSTGATPPARLSPTFGDLGGHTLGLGLETVAGGFTVTLGWSRTWSPAIRAPTALQFDNPFPSAGDGPIYEGAYDASLDQVGILIEAELGVADPLPKPSSGAANQPRSPQN